MDSVFRKDGTACIHTSEETTCLLERALKITFCGLAKNIECDRLGVIQRLEAHYRLDEERLGVSTDARGRIPLVRRGRVRETGRRHAPHVSVEERHHGDTDVRTAHELGDLAEVIVSDGRHHQIPRVLRLLG